MPNYKDVQNKINKVINSWYKGMSYEQQCEWELEILNILKPYRYECIGDSELSKLVKAFVKDDNDDKEITGIEIPSSYYDRKVFNNFIEYFTRKLSLNKFEELKNKTKNCDFVTPCHGYIEAIDDVENSKRIVRLKKPYKDVIKDLEEMNIDIKGYKYIDIKLLLTHYHRIHSPVKGKIFDLIPIKKGENFFGENSLWIVDFLTKNGHVYMLIVGESLIQDFNFLVKKGNDIEIFQEIGHFNWGSQIVLFYDAKKFNQVILQENKTYFVGEILTK